MFTNDMTRDDLNMTNKEMKKFIKDGTKENKISEKPTRQQLYFLYKLIMNRVHVQISCFDIFKYRLAKLCLCCKSLQKSKSFKTNLKRLKVFKRGQKKLANDLDLVKLIHTNMENAVNRSVSLIMMRDSFSRSKDAESSCQTAIVIKRTRTHCNRLTLIYSAKKRISKTSERRPKTYLRNLVETNLTLRLRGFFQASRQRDISTLKSFVSDKISPNNSNLSGTRAIHQIRIMSRLNLSRQSGFTKTPKSCP